MYDPAIVRVCCESSGTLRRLKKASRELDSFRAYLNALQECEVATKLKHSIYMHTKSAQIPGNTSCHVYQPDCCLLFFAATTAARTTTVACK